VADDADHARPGVGHAVGVVPDLAADRTSPGKKELGRTLAQDDHFFRVSLVLIVERAALEQGDAHGVEVARSYIDHRSGSPISMVSQFHGPRASHLHVVAGAIGTIGSVREPIRCAYGNHSGNLADAVDDLAEVCSSCLDALLSGTGFKRR